MREDLLKPVAVVKVWERKQGGLGKGVAVRLERNDRLEIYVEGRSNTTL